MKSLEIWSEMKDEASTFGKSDTDASVFLNAYIDPFETCLLYTSDAADES